MDHSCAYLAGLLGDPLLATANETAAWILLEHSGPWGKNALRDSDLDPEVVAECERRLADTGVRVQLMAPARRGSPQWIYLAADPYRGTPWLARMPCTTPRDVLAVDFAALAEGELPAGAQVVTQPLYLVCANEQSDPCCGRTGPPVLAAATARLGPRCRATTHLGGHKYAANMMVFPYASCYGRLGPDPVRDVITATENGNLHLGQYRGRAAYAAAEQAAEHFLRLELGLAGLPDVTLVERATQDEAGRRHVVFAVNGHRRYDVVVRSERRGPARLQSCTDSHPTLPVSWTCDAVTESAAQPVGVDG